MKKLIFIILPLCLSTNIYAQAVNSADVSIFELSGTNSSLCTVTILNTHDDAARNVKLEVLIPFQTTATRVSTGCTIQPSGRVVICNLGTINVNEKKSVKVYTNRQVPEAYRSNLSFSAYVSNTLPDPILSNNFKTINVAY